MTSTVAAGRRVTVDKDRALTLLQNYGVYAAIVLLVIVNIAFTADFLTVSQPAGPAVPGRAACSSWRSAWPW